MINQKFVRLRDFQLQKNNLTKHRPLIDVVGVIEQWVEVDVERIQFLILQNLETEFSPVKLGYGAKEAEPPSMRILDQFYNYFIQTPDQ